MEPLAALGLASNIFQVVDFSARLLSRSEEFYNSASGGLSTHEYLAGSAKRLRELAAPLITDMPQNSAEQATQYQASLKQFKADRRERFMAGEIETKRWVPESYSNFTANREVKGQLQAESRRRREDEQHLVELSAGLKRITQNILDAMSAYKPEGDASRLKSIRLAVRSIWNDQQIKSMEGDLDNIRKQIDTALLFSVRNRLNDSTLVGDSAVQREMLAFMRQFSNMYRPILDEIGRKSRLGNFQNRPELLQNAIHAAIDQKGRAEGEPDDLDSLPAGQLVGLPHVTIEDLKQNTVEQLAYRMEYLIQTQSSTSFKQIIYSRLKFEEMPDREERIPQAFESTFEWIFKSPDMHSDHASWSNFAEWLNSPQDEHIYWITGKPGSGKSTLMKYLHRSDKTMSNLRGWAGSRPLFHAAFFFWNSGTSVQMSRIGLLRTLLFGLVRQLESQGTNGNILEHTFADRWEQYNAFGEGMHTFTWRELKRCFDVLLSNSDNCFYLSIDGLDEFDGEASEMIDFVVQASKRPNVKICTASRPWPIFEDAFHNSPSLYLEELTRNDIRTYVDAKFNNNRRFEKILAADMQIAHNLTQGIIRKASGVFLWVYLVVDTLSSGLTNGDTMPELLRKLDELPADLEALFDKLLHKVDPRYHRQACELIRLVEDQAGPSLLELSFADDENVQSGMTAPIRPLTPNEISSRIDSMKRRLKSRCKGFLEVYEPGSAADGIIASLSDRLKVGYLHRTARDYLRSDLVRAKLSAATLDPPFAPCQNWANGFLWALKVLEPRASKEGDSFGVKKWHAWRPLSWCVEYALRMQQVDGRVHTTYLEQVNLAGIQAIQKFWQSGHVVAPRPFDSFIELAAYLNLQDYIRLKLECTKPNDLRKALKATASRGDMNEWLKGRHCLLMLQDSFKQRNANDLVRTLRYYERSPALRMFSSRPKYPQPKYI